MLIISIFKILLNLIYIPFKLCPMKKKVLFLSRQSNTLSLEYKMIINELKKSNPSIEIVTITKKLDRNLKSLITNFFLLFKQMYHISTSKIVMTDGYSVPISILKHKKQLVIIQMWHANGIIKKIGLQTLKTRSKFEKKLAKSMNMHKNYTYVISSSKNTSKVFKEAFGVKTNQILNFGTPMLDYIYEGKNKKDFLINKYNIDKNKKIVLYLPTYRKEITNINDIVKNFDFNEYTLVLKAHPVMKCEEVDKRIVTIKNEIAEDLISIADYVVTDYSNVAFEAILTNKKTYFYLYDYEEYTNKFGLNIDLKKEIPQLILPNDCKHWKKVFEKKYDFKKSNKFTYKYIETFDGKCTKRIIDFLNIEMNNDV